MYDLNLTFRIVPGVEGYDYSHFANKEPCILEITSQPSSSSVWGVQSPAGPPLTFVFSGYAHGFIIIQFILLDLYLTELRHQPRQMCGQQTLVMVTTVVVWLFATPHCIDKR